MRGLKTVFVGGAIHHAIGRTGEFAVKLEEVLRAVHEALETRGYRLLSAHQYERFGELDHLGGNADSTHRAFPPL